MGLSEIFSLGFALSMDAFAVSVCKGLASKKLTFKYAFIIGLYFGVFQAAMPLIGYGLASRFQSYIEKFDHWIAFGLLVIIGVNMIREALKKDEEESDDSLKVGTMLLLAVATSIDALAVGVSMAFTGLNINIFAAVGIIGVTTLILSMVGVKIGNVFGEKYKAKAEITGGVILILLGLKILLEDLGVLSF